MAIPSDPTLTSVVTEGLKRGGRVSPSATQITDATEHQLREVKSDITQRSSRHQVLETQYATATVDGQSRYTWPTDADDIRSLTLITSDSDTYWQGAATAGAATTITLSASFSQETAVVKGKFIYLLGGTGANQFAQVTGYDNSTKVATVDRTWTTNPAAATTYHLGLAHRKLYTFDKPWGYDALNAPYQRGIAWKAAPVGREMWLNCAADRIYALWWDYWANLDRIDEAGAVFIRHLREYRSLWVQGLAVKTMQRYDEDRYQLELQVYNNMLDAYAGVAAGVGQVNFTDV